MIDGVLRYAAIDGRQRRIVQHGRQLCGDALELAGHAREAVAPARYTAR